MSQTFLLHYVNSWVQLLNVLFVFSVRPEITKPHSDRWNVMFGDSVIAECLADASPTAQYVWKNETVGVVSNDRYLRLNNVDDIDGGNYTCTTANILGSDNFTSLVEVTSEFH